VVVAAMDVSSVDGKLRRESVSSSGRGWLAREERPQAENSAALLCVKTNAYP
jgi:hypothetical protein